jgi:DNA polymerase-1
MEISPRAESLAELREIDVVELKGLLNQGQVLWGFFSAQGLFVAFDQQIFQLRGEASDLGIISDDLGLGWKGFDLKTFWHLMKPQRPVAMWDSMLAAYVMKPGESMALEQVYARTLGEALPELLSPQELYLVHQRLERALEKSLIEVNGERVYRDLDLPLAKILYQMENRGVALDCDLLKAQGGELAREIRACETRVHELAGEVFNIGSPKQLSHILFEKMQIPVGKKTKTGFSTDNEVLGKIRHDHPIADFILTYRELTKLKSTYVDALPLLVKEDGRIHSTFNQALTTTGRLSSIEPNLQNIPIRTERGARVRKAFVAAPEKMLLSVDYSQIELRILAHFSEDPNLIRAFHEDLDIHTATAAEVFGIAVHSVSAEQRRVAKAVNFGIAYGQGAFGLAEVLGISRSEASDIIKRYFGKFARVQNYIEDTIATAKSRGYVETLSGRRRYMDELKSKNAAIQKFGERAAINAPIQGTASDLVKKAMIEVDQKIELPIILQIHDELIFEGSLEKIEEFRPQIIRMMESVAQLRVPLKANSGLGKNWDSAK